MQARQDRVDSVVIAGKMDEYMRIITEGVSSQGTESGDPPEQKERSSTLSERLFARLNSASSGGSSGHASVGETDLVAENLELRLQLQQRDAQVFHLEQQLRSLGSEQQLISSHTCQHADSKAGDETQEAFSNARQKFALMEIELNGHQKMIQALKLQLKDKDDIIEMLKEQMILVWKHCPDPDIFKSTTDSNSAEAEAAEALLTQGAASPRTNGPVAPTTNGTIQQEGAGFTNLLCRVMDVLQVPNTGDTARSSCNARVEGSKAKAVPSVVHSPPAAAHVVVPQAETLLTPMLSSPAVTGVMVPQAEAVPTAVQSPQVPHVRIPSACVARSSSPVSIRCNPPLPGPSEAWQGRTLVSRQSSPSTPAAERLSAKVLIEGRSPAGEIQRFLSPRAPSVQYLSQDRVVSSVNTAHSGTLVNPPCTNEASRFRSPNPCPTSPRCPSATSMALHGALPPRTTGNTPGRLPIRREVPMQLSSQRARATTGMEQLATTIGFRNSQEHVSVQECCSGTCMLDND